MKRSLLLTLLLISAFCKAQSPADTSSATSNKFKFSYEVGGDFYYKYAPNEIDYRYQTVFSNYRKLHSFDFNLVYGNVKVSYDAFRSSITLAAGTYIDPMFQQSFLSQFIMEANVGVCLSKSKQLWIDAGTFNSPLTAELPFAYDQVMYSRSLGSEHVSYSVTGVRLSMPLTQKLNVYAYVLNGWQPYLDNNPQKSGLLSLEYKLSPKCTLTLNQFAGNELSKYYQNSWFGDRYFTDFYVVYKASSGFVLNAGAYYGIHQLESESANWYNANVMAKYPLNRTLSVAARLERFDDVNSVVTETNMFGKGGGRVLNSATLGLNYQATKECMARIEVRHLEGENYAFSSNAGGRKSTTQILAGLNLKISKD